uniref:(northern house mosquito) hypothetical protein n=1 Tax=Culex pipiens TaxID=7175 RepID=A0A8D8A908_CULPI
MNLLVVSGLLLAVLTVQFVQGVADERIHFPQDEPERTFDQPRPTVNPVQRVSNCETPTTKKKVLVYDSETDSWDDSDLLSPTNSRVPCTDHGTSLSSANEGLKPAVQEARPPRCDPPKQILVYDSDTDSWEEALLKNC